MEDLGRFMKAVGATLMDVATATGLAESTVSRIRSGASQHPSWETVQVICEWADAEARRRKLKRELWLSVGETRRRPARAGAA